MSIENDEHPQAVRLARYISIYLNPDTFIDFGCSTGLYLKEVQEALPMITTMGFEFSQDAVNAGLCKNIHQVDLTKNINIETNPNTLAVCLEVLEHIEDKHWRCVLYNIIQSCDKLIFSAAVPGQVGTGHINCRPKIDWIKRFHELGWVVDFDATVHLLDYMKQGYHMGWFANNAIVLIPYKN